MGVPTLITRIFPGPSTAVEAARARELIRFGNITRWLGLALFSTVGIAQPPRMAPLLALLVAWLATYNAASIYLRRQLDDHEVMFAGRTLILLDMLSLFAFMALYAPHDPVSLYAIAGWILVEAIALEGSRGAVIGLALFIAGLLSHEWLEVSGFGQAFEPMNVLLWVAIMGILAAAIVKARAAPAALSRSQDTGAAAVPVRSPAGTLSDRELQVLRLLAEGYSNTQIAAHLHVSENTVKRHVAGLLSRLQARNRAEAVAHALRLRLF